MTELRGISPSGERLVMAISQMQGFMYINHVTEIICIQNYCFYSAYFLR